ncbi:hypothetical protein [Streptomyces sp. N35]|uniref:hypothetical protein n=1 Tax=Streptomyces sp. N35 TaxID=2795730 RepID=UPI0018F701A4|nr:hypothetical protein [Streptomyces sp. N35]
MDILEAVSREAAREITLGGAWSVVRRDKATGMDGANNAKSCVRALQPALQRKMGYDVVAPGQIQNIPHRPASD